MKRYISCETWSFKEHTKLPLIWKIAWGDTKWDSNVGRSAKWEVIMTRKEFKVARFKLFK